MNTSDFFEMFGDIFPEKYEENEQDLDEIWDEYNDLVNSLKSKGYKVMRNSSGKHKIIKQ